MKECKKEKEDIARQQAEKALADVPEGPEGEAVTESFEEEKPEESVLKEADAEGGESKHKSAECGIPEDAVPEKRKKGLNNDGVGVIEIILILVVLVTLVLIFKNQLTGIVERAMAALEKSMDKILN